MRSNARAVRPADCAGTSVARRTRTQAILHRQLVYPGHLTSEAVAFLSTALTRDPKARPTVRQLLQHPFILQHTAGSC
jgi:serine/threonine protein kinase